MAFPAQQSLSGLDGDSPWSDDEDRRSPVHAVHQGRVRAVSYGGGVQSTALLVLAAQQRIDFDLFLFANVGDDSEHPATLDYVRQVARPFAVEAGVELVELRRQWMRGPRKGKQVTLYEELVRPGSRSVPIPVRMSNGAPGRRSCTADFKIRVVGRELRRRGASRDEPAAVALGISVDEIERAKPGTDPRTPVQERVYPLLDLQMSRQDCARVITEAGLPVPPKSSCWFCPFHDAEAWHQLRSERPDLFDRACELEAVLNDRRHDLGPVWLTRHGRPLGDVMADQALHPGLDGCDSGWCMT